MDIVNLSFGNSYSPGIDPLEAMVGELPAEENNLPAPLRHPFG